MAEFDPAEAAVLLDRCSDGMIGWTGERCGDYRRAAVPQADGTVQFDGMVLDGWGQALGG